MLLDQRVIAGLGNMLVDEVLFWRGLTRVVRLSPLVLMNDANFRLIFQQSLLDW